MRPGSLPILLLLCGCAAAPIPIEPARTPVSPGISVEGTVEDPGALAGRVGLADRAFRGSSRVDEEGWLVVRLETGSEHAGLAIEIGFPPSPSAPGRAACVQWRASAPYGWGRESRTTWARSGRILVERAGDGGKKVKALSFDLDFSVGHLRGHCRIEGEAGP